MSIKIMTAVWDRYSGSGNELLLALALPDHAHDDGMHIYPTVKTLADKTRQSVRTVQRQLASMVEERWLIKTANEINTRDFKRGCEYRINPDWLADKQHETASNDVQQPDAISNNDTGDKMSSVYADTGDKNEGTRVTKSDDTGDKAVSPKPSFKPSINHHKVVHTEKLTFDRETAKFKNLPEGILNQWTESYPAIDIVAEIRKAASWLISNPKNSKSDYLRFLNNWLARAQDRAPRVNAINPIPAYQSVHEKRSQVASDMLGVFTKQQYNRGEQLERVVENVQD